MAAFSLTTNPSPLGYIKPTAGTPLQLTSNFTSGLANVSFQSILIAAHPDNAGNVYVLSSRTYGAGTVGADTTNGTNVLAVLGPAQSFPISAPEISGPIPSQFWIDVATTGDIAVPCVYA